MISNLQIISGKWRGRKLSLPATARPTQNRARIALFNIIESNGLVDFSQPFEIWDAFAGSGVFGIECLSRYPNAHVLFTDIDSDSIKTVKKNLPALENVTVVQKEALGMIDFYGSSVDLVFLDPPYDRIDLARSFVRKFSGVAKPGSVIILEVEKDTVLGNFPDKIEVLKDKTYGRARFLVLRTN